MKHWTDIKLPIPNWINTWTTGIQETFPEVEQRMALTIDLARINLKYGGGPFGAAVFNKRTGELIAPGVNWVIPGKSSLLHAEVMALALAEQTLGSYELASHGSFELVTSVEPCCQCLGVLVWTGVASVVCGACSEDAEAIGFNEGPRPLDWEQELVRRGISVTREVMRPQAVEVLQSYIGEIYNVNPKNLS
ncbi:MAG: nucleoside deaminase [Nitrosomonas sp.]|nr:nucleoside deaminase [Nitrosomonas sp.]MDP1950882.1 nucleoside deaminase [Nitrosomonas sp.]